MATFKKMYVSDVIASNTTRILKRLTTKKPKLSAPTISINGDIISITANNNTNWLRYEMYVNGELYDNLLMWGNKPIDLYSRYNFGLGTYIINLVAQATGYEESEHSNSVQYVVAEHTIQKGKYVFNDVLPYTGVNLYFAIDPGNVVFTSNGELYNTLGVMGLSDDLFSMSYSYNDGDMMCQYYDYAYCFGYDDKEDGWQDENLKTINLLKDITTRSQSGYNWFIANTTKE